MKYHFTYQTRNLINGKTYIGVHSTEDIKDGYIGCGIYKQSDAKARVKKRKAGGLPLAVVKYGYKNFSREILSFFDTAEEAYEEESWLVDEAWVKSGDNYNIKLGGDVPPINDVRDTKHYRGIIYQVDINTGEVLNQAASAGEMAKRTGLYQSRISEILRGVKSRYRNYFFTRNLHTWKTDREELLEKFFQDRLRLSKERSGAGRSVGVSAFNTDGSLFKSFSSTQEALRFFNKSPRAGKTIYNSIDYTKINPEKPRVTYGFIWRYTDEQ